MHASSRFANVYFAAFTRNLIPYFTCFRGSNTVYDLRVVSNIKTDRTPCCYRQRRSGWDKRLMYDRTAVDLISVAGSLSDACQFLDFVQLVTNQ